MVHVISRENRRRHAAALDLMHRDRKRVFVDQHGWNVPVVDGVYERDQFDTDDAVYLVACAPADGRHLVSVRLLPTTRPHLLNSLFPDLCPDAPVGHDVWEITRLCFAPSLRGAERQRLLETITLAVAEYGLLFGVNRYVCMAYTSFLSQILAQGWDCEPLCLPRRVDRGEPVGVVSLAVKPATLALFRTQWSARLPVLELESFADAA